VDHVPGLPAATDSVQTVHVKRPAGAHGPRPTAHQHGRNGRVRCCVPADESVLESTDAEKTHGPGRIPGRVGVQRQSGVGQHALVIERGVADRGCCKGDRRDAHHAA